MGYRRPSAVVSSSLALLVGGAVAACGAVLGLDAPTLAPSPDGSSAPAVDANGTSSGGDSTLPQDASPVSAPEAGADAPPNGLDASDDQAVPDGVRCGPAGSAIYCSGASSWCCLVFDDAGAGSYSCQAGETACSDPPLSGYPIECASDNDCSGSEVCCFYHTGLKCSAASDPNCTVLVCDPSGPSDQCNAGQSCSPGDIDAGLPYHACQ